MDNLKNKPKEWDINYGGKREGSGRKPKLNTVIKDFIEEHPKAYDEMMQVLYELATNRTDREAAQYIIDRLKGRPTSTIKSINVTLTGSDIKAQVLALREAAQSTQGDLNESTDGIVLLENTSEDTNATIKEQE